MGPLHWSSFFWTQKVGLGKMILTGPEFGHFVLLCPVSGMVEVFTHRWGQVSHSFGSHLFLACHILRGFEARLLCLMDVQCRSKNEKGSPTIPRVFWPGSIQLSKAIFLADIDTVSGYFLLTLLTFSNISCWHYWHFLGWKIEPSSFWRSHSFPRINDPFFWLRGGIAVYFATISGTWFHPWCLCFVVCICLYFPFWLINW